MPFNAGLDIGSLIVGAAGLFGGSSQPEMTWQQQVLLNMMIKNLRAQKRYGEGIAGSDPQEQAALASARANAGESFAQGREQLLASLGTENPNAADALGQFASAQAGTFAGIDMSALLQFLQNRQNVKFGIASQAAQGLGVATAARPPMVPGMDFSALAGALGRQAGYGSGPLPPPGGGLPAGYGAGLVRGVGNAFPPPPITGTNTTNFGARPWEDKNTWM